MAKILVVDDELGLREALYYAFSRRGHQVTTAINNEHATEMLGTQPFDLIILDIVMPGEPGTELLRRMRAQGSKVPVVIYSVKADALFEKEMHQAGANEVMHKNTPLEILIDRTEKVLRTAGKAATAGVVRKLLVIDDEKAVRQMLAAFFQRKGYQVIEASAGDEGLEKIRQVDPDIVLLDLSLSEGLTGLQTLQRIRDEWPKLGVVMATGDDDTQKMNEAMQMGAYGYVLKPFDLLYLELVVASRLTIAQTPDGPAA